MTPLFRRKPKKPRLLAVLLCYNDGDILRETISYLLEQDHQVIAWDHGSDDGTAEVLASFGSDLLESTFIPRDFDFYRLYPTMSQHLLDNYVEQFDWISWPDQDEFLEGPNRSKSYRDWIYEVADSPYDWIQFCNFNYWWTADDDASATTNRERVRHYALFPDCAPRIRSWRASVTNIREFNHNPPLGTQYPELFNLCHYPMRNEQQMQRRLEKDRAGLRRGGANFHYDNMLQREQLLRIPASALHFDDGGDLSHETTFNWRDIYGFASE